MRMEVATAALRDSTLTGHRNPDIAVRHRRRLLRKSVSLIADEKSRIRTVIFILVAYLPL